MTDEIASLREALDVLFARYARCPEWPRKVQVFAKLDEWRALQGRLDDLATMTRERDEARAERDNFAGELGFIKNDLSNAIHRATKAEAQVERLAAALRKTQEAIERVMEDRHNCGDPGVECPLQDAGKSWHVVQEALTLSKSALAVPAEPHNSYFLSRDGVYKDGERISQPVPAEPTQP